VTRRCRQNDEIIAITLKPKPKIINE